MLTAQAAVAENGARPVRPPQVIDLELEAGGALRGTIVNPEGRPVGGGKVAVHCAGREVARCLANRQGQFLLQGLPAGPCQLQLLTATQPCRLWAAGTAPPKAPRELLLVAGQPTERGQQPIGRLLGNPVVIGLIIATAVTIPIATRDRNGS
jgi:hypothetical protein